MGAGCPIRLVEITRAMKDTIAQAISDEGENDLHSKRKKKEPRRKVTIIKRKKNELGQMVKDEEYIFPPYPNITPGRPYMTMPVEEFHELLDENIFQMSVIEQAWFHHVVKLPENGFILPVTTKTTRKL